MDQHNNLLKLGIILCCLLAPVFDANFSNLLTLVFDTVIGFEPAKITHFGVLGCYPETWMYVAAYLTFLPLSFALNILGYYLSQREQLIYKLIGALLLYRIVFAIAESALFSVLGGSHPLWFIEKKEMFLGESVPVFGNFYIYKWFSFILGICLQTFYLFLCYRVIFRSWDKQMRLYFFTYGAASCGLGLYLWYFVIGPLLYS